jgi:hypothetical protein
MTTLNIRSPCAAMHHMALCTAVGQRAALVAGAGALLALMNRGCPIAARSLFQFLPRGSTRLQVHMAHEGVKE